MIFEGTDQELRSLRSFADHAIDSILLVDASLSIRYYNRAVETMLGVRLSKPFYRKLSCADLLGFNVDFVESVFQPCLESKRPLRLVELEAEVITGEARTFNLSAVPMLRSDGSSFGVLVFLRDVTDEASIQRKYKQLLDRSQSIALTGKLENGSLPDVLQLLIFLRKTGKLALLNGESAGEMLFREGRLLSVQLGPVMGEKALGRLVQWKEGRFEFLPELPAGAPPGIGKHADFILMDALRERDEMEHLSPTLPAFDAKLTLAKRPDRCMIEAFDRLLLDLVEQGATVHDLLGMLTETDGTIIKALVELKKQDVLTW